MVPGLAAQHWCWRRRHSSALPTSSLSSSMQMCSPFNISYQDCICSELNRVFGVMSAVRSTTLGYPAAFPTADSSCDKGCLTTVYSASWTWLGCTTGDVVAQHAQQAMQSTLLF